MGKKLIKHLTDIRENWRRKLTIIRNVSIVAGTVEHFKAQLSFYVQLGLLLTNSTFCLENTFMRSTWMLEQTEVILNYSIKQLVFTTETEGLLCGKKGIFKYNLR
jgi:hypothetical protein